MYLHKKCGLKTKVELQSDVSNIAAHPSPPCLNGLHEELVSSFWTPLIELPGGQQNRPIACRVSLKSIHVWHWLSILQHEVVQQTTSHDHWAYILQFRFPQNSTKNSPNTFE